MHSRRLIAAAVLASALFAGITSAQAAGGDIYSRLMDMKAMDLDKDSMVSKEEFLEMVSKLWDMKTGEMKVRDGKLTAAQLRELEKVLGRSLGAPSGS